MSVGQQPWTRFPCPWVRVEFVSSRAMRGRKQSMYHVQSSSPFPRSLLDVDCLRYFFLLLDEGPKAGNALQVRLTKCFVKHT